MPAGSQEMDIYVNGSWKGRYTVIYGEQRDDIRLAWKDARSLGINTTSVPAPAIAHGQVQLRDLVQGGEVKTDTSTLSLYQVVFHESISAGIPSSQNWGAM